jgi:hypothetical protein
MGAILSHPVFLSLEDRACPVLAFCAGRVFRRQKVGFGRLRLRDREKEISVQPTLIVTGPASSNK